MEAVIIIENAYMNTYNLAKGIAIKITIIYSLAESTSSPLKYLLALKEMTILIVNAIAKVKTKTISNFIANSLDNRIATLSPP